MRKKMIKSIAKQKLHIFIKAVATAPFLIIPACIMSWDRLEMMLDVMLNILQEFWRQSM